MHLNQRDNFACNSRSECVQHRAFFALMIPSLRKNGHEIERNDLRGNHATAGGVVAAEPRPILENVTIRNFLRQQSLAQVVPAR